MKLDIRNPRSIGVSAILFIILGVIIIYFLFRAERQEISYMELVARLDKARTLLEENRIEEALAKYNEIFELISENWYAEVYARTKNTVGIAYSDLAQVEDYKGNLKRAIRAYKEALKVYTLELYPGQYAMVQNNLANAYMKAGTTVKNLTNKIKAHREALKGYAVMGDTLMYAYSRRKLGDSYFKLAKFQDEQDNLKKAIRSYEEALKVYTLEKHPSDYESIKEKMTIAKEMLE